MYENLGGEMVLDAQKFCVSARVNVDTLSTNLSGRATAVGGQPLNNFRNKLSATIWEIDWNRYFPLVFEDHLSVEVSTYEQNIEFAKTYYPTIYREDSVNSHFIVSENMEKKSRYFMEAGDFFIFRDGVAPIGIFVGTPIDWSGYYLRNASFLPAYQGKKLYQRFLSHFLKCLTLHGVDRAEGDVGPSNLAHIHILNKLEFNINGLFLSERWGSLLHFTKFLNPKNESVFLDQFCWGVRPQQDKIRSS